MRIFEQPLGEALLVERLTAPTTPGQEPHAGVVSAIAAGSPPERTKSPRLISST